MKSTPITSLSASKSRKRSRSTSRIGYIVMESIPHYAVDNVGSKCKPETRARDFIQQMEIIGSVVITVQKSEHSKEKFFWSGRELYSMKYAATNYLAFTELRSLANTIRAVNLDKSTGEPASNVKNSKN